MMMNDNDFFQYNVWSTNRFSSKLLNEHVAKFNNLELAQEFVNYQATLSNNFVIIYKGERVDEDL